MTRHLILTLLALTLALPAGAADKENGTRGGADQMTCKGLFGFIGGGVSLFDLEAEQRNVFPLGFFSTFANPRIVRDTLVDFLTRKNPEEGAELRDALAHIKDFVPVDKLEKLDTGAKVGALERVVLFCSREQIAVQDFNRPAPGFSTVRILKTVDKTYGAIERALLEIHEGYLYIAHKRSNVLPVMETEARSQVSKLWNTDGVIAYLLPEVLRRVGDPKATLENNTKHLFGWMLGSPFNSDDKITWMTRELIGAGMDPNRILDCRLPMLEYALFHLTGGVGDGRPGQTSAAAATELVKAGARIDQPDMAGRLPIHMAAYADDGDFAKLLLEKGADKDAGWCKPGAKPGSSPWTALDMASDPGQGNSYSVKDVLKKAGARHGSELGWKCGTSEKISKSDLKREKCEQVLKALAPDANPRFGGGGLWSLIRHP